MNIKLFDKILLKTGETACIVEIYEQGVAYEADIDNAAGTFKKCTNNLADRLATQTLSPRLNACKKINRHTVTAPNISAD